MGGGASKNHKKHVVECSAKEEGSSHQEQLQLEAKHGSVTRESQSPRHQSPHPSHSGNDGDEEEVDNQHSVRKPYDDLDDEEDEDELDPEEDNMEEYNGEEEEEEEETEEAMQLRMLFAQSAMSMDMDNEDLIFNLLYFGESSANFASMMNNAAEETVAAHSQGNTPYKLAPASDNALKKLKVVAVTEELINEHQLQDCLICQEEMESGNSVVLLPGCNHCFHNDCVLKWFTLQSWCPVCRAKIVPDGAMDTDQIERIVEEEEESPRVNKINAADQSLGDVKSTLGPLFNDFDDERVDEKIVAD